MVAVGIVLVGAGALSLFAGIAGGIAEMVKGLRGPQAFAATPGAEGVFDPFKQLEQLMKALTEFMKALASAPEWLALVTIGFFAIFAGGLMIGRG